MKYIQAYGCTRQILIISSPMFKRKASLFTFQVHIDYNFKHGKYLALNGGYADGGETSLNGMGAA